ncbi:Protein of unknown function DUF131 [Methanothermus fervidus DSM 2088]|uniref:TIGR00304 family protein n=1 Tax=Methanothermus fervidus (strain ATCC 43054 / DSM 2088 / JCM 10308 / V24 S) TaxID=523846 RepID=E3GZA2_METFV|nr:TIGR00304 family protein [Methanothermus fervidus]ADP77634.1 Protein of unknown function DUF131 [Methanothermus fervidus DSM 2088]
MRADLVVLFGIVIVFLGMLLVIVGSILQYASVSKTGKSEVKTGGVVMIGPIPIIFGSDRQMAILGVVLAIILMILAYILFYRV